MRGFTTQKGETSVRVHYTEGRERSVTWWSGQMQMQNANAKCKCKSYLRSEDLQQVTLAYGYYVRPHAFDKAVWSTAGQCGPSVRPRDTTRCTESGMQTRTTDLQFGESTLKPTAPTCPTNWSWRVGPVRVLESYQLWIRAEIGSYH